MIYPFTAIVGQEKMKKALILNAINPKIGGVLLRGDRGTGKSTAVRAFVEVLPEIEVYDCKFNCSKDAPCDRCKELSDSGKIKVIKKRMKIVELPLSATEDRVVGTIDVERILQEGIKAFQPGILAEANNNVLYIDEVNLLDDHIVDTLLDVAASGWNIVEREGVSLKHPSRFILIGTMNPEEGELRPQLLDRFGMVVDVKAIKDPDQRAEIVKRVEEFSENPINFYKRFESEQKKLSRRIELAKRILPEVNVSEEVILNVAKLCSKLNINTHRAEIVTIRAAKALAAFNGRREVTFEDVRDVVELTLPHRAKVDPFEENLEFDKVKKILKDFFNVDENGKDFDENFESFEGNSRLSANQKKHGFGDVNIPKLEMKVNKVALKGRRVKSVTDYGKYVDFRMNGKNLAIFETIKAAICRGSKNPSKQDFRYKLCRGRVASSIAVLVDASGSMAALSRMELAKGLILKLAKDIYIKKDRVCLITFRDNAARVAIPPTSSPHLIVKKVANLTTGGKTPLYDGLSKAYKVLKVEMRKNLIPILVLISDGRANVSRSGNLKEEIFNVSKKIARSGILTVVFDADDYVSLGYSREISKITGGLYFRLKELNPESISNIVNKVRLNPSFFSS